MPNKSLDLGVFWDGKHRTTEEYQALMQVRVCTQCANDHIRIDPVDRLPCNRVECECWCTTGTGQ